MTDTWIAILQKLLAGTAKTAAFRRSWFLLKQHDPTTTPSLSIPKTTFICFNAPRDLHRRIYHAFNLGRIPSPKTVDGVIADPFRLLLLVIMAWYHWNNALFWALRNHLQGLEQINGIRGAGLLHSGTAEYAYMHLMAKDIYQTEELLHFALKMMGRLKALHEQSFDRQVSGDMLDALEQTGAALDYQCSRFEGLMDRVQALPKRINNQISFVSGPEFPPNMCSRAHSHQTFHLGQQHGAKTAQGSSDSVKTISILTLLFLPGTGIAVRRSSITARSSCP
jgi:hypothetical protein